MKFQFTILFLSLLIAFSSCEKVIDIDIKDADKKYVIEAAITDEPGGARVLISTTKNFSDNNNFNGIANATVTITDSEGNNTQLTALDAGIYGDPILTAEPGKTYILSVNINGDNFTAQSKMPLKLNMDTLYITQDYVFGEITNIAVVEYSDPPGRGESVRFVMYKNGVKSKSIYIQDDEYTDGRQQLVRLRERGPDDNELKSGDVIKVDMLNIDAPVYKYWNSFLSGGSTGSNNTASPANPISNISGDALGYFSAHTIQSRTVTVP